MNASEALRSFLAPLLAGWRIQYGRWVDGGNDHRYAVLRPMGGLPVSLVRRPQFSLTLIAAVTDVASLPETVAQTVITAMNTGAGALVFMEPAEPVFWATNDGRPVAELAISTITSNT